VFSGLVTGVSLSILVGALWTALAFGSHRSAFYDHLAWWFAATAIGGTFFAALVAALVSGTRGAASGLANGLTTWGLVVIATVAGAIPGIAAYGSTRPITVNGIRVAVTTVRPWTTFWALLIGLGVALLGGLLGGMGRRQHAPRRTMATPVDVRDQPRPVAPVASEPAPVMAQRY